MAFVVAQRGGLEHRDMVRKLLVDPLPQVRALTARGLLSNALLEVAPETVAEDEKLLRANNVPLTQKGLTDFLQQRSLSEKDQERLKALIQQLGHPSYALREKALRAILDIDLPALGFLLDALNSKEAEIVLRAEICIQEIRQGPGPALPAAAVRGLAKFPSEETVETLIRYIPFAPDEKVEEDVIETLCRLSIHQEKVAPALVKALSDPLPARKGAAAYVLGKVGTLENCRGLEKFLADPHPIVRYRAAQGLLAAKNAAAVPTLIDLLDLVPKEKIWQIEDVLHRVAGETSPDVYVSADDPKAKAGAVKQWQQWWVANKGKIDLGDAAFDERHLGIFTVCEYDNPNGRVGGRVWECGRDGKPRWEIDNVMGPMDAQVLPNGRVLIAESNSRKITERDKTGNIVWEYTVPNNPVTVQRLPNGNTFIATYRDLMEVTPDKRVVYNHNRNLAIIYYSAKKLRNNHIVATTSRGELVELDSANGNTIKTIKLQPGGWSGVDVLANGHYLVSQMTQNAVMELDRDGNKIRQFNYNGVFRAHALPNGNCVVASMNLRKVAEVDRQGRVIWEHSCQGRPWNIRFR